MGERSWLVPVVKCLTCLRWVGTDSPETKPGLAGQEKAPHSSLIFLSMSLPEWMYCLTSHTHNNGQVCENMFLYVYWLLLSIVCTVTVGIFRRKSFYMNRGEAREQKTHCVCNWEMKAVEVNGQGRLTGVKLKTHANTIWVIQLRD